MVLIRAERDLFLQRTDRIHRSAPFLWLKSSMDDFLRDQTGSLWHASSNDRLVSVNRDRTVVEFFSWFRLGFVWPVERRKREISIFRDLISRGHRATIIVTRAKGEEGHKRKKMDRRVHRCDVWSRAFMVVAVLLFLALVSFPTPSHGATPSAQIQALELLFNSTRGENWKWKNQQIRGPFWSFASPQPDPCNDGNRSWQGITCSSLPNVCISNSCEIVSLALPGYALDGTLPSETFSKLTSLTKLDISLSLTLTGPIPSSVGSLKNLVDLYLFQAHFTGTIPTEIGFLSLLTSLALHANQLSGEIPSLIGFLSKMKFVSLYSNQLSGTIPNEFGSLSRLGYLTIEACKLTGTIPSTLTSLPQLRFLSLFNNRLTGTIPSSFGSALQCLYLQKNQLTGTIPLEIFSLSQLTYLYLSVNQLTGTIPTNLSSLTQLKYFYLNSNSLIGTIPSMIGALSRLETLGLYQNDLTGTIPSEIGSLSHLRAVYLHWAQLSGTIPSTIGSLSQLEYLYLYNNLLTGTIPSSISNLTNIIWLHFHQNHLQGPITFALTSFPSLGQLFLQQNRLTGNLNQLVSSLNRTSSRLINLDVSDNLFSGSIPSALFLPHLQSISLSLNCFAHELPDSMCEARAAEVLSMDGLGSAKGCGGVVNFPLTSVSLVQTMTGSIPDCVWLMSDLKMLNLAGNGLIGDIGGTNVSMQSLLSLTLSHNYLSGTIPLWLQTKNMSHLDLSHNKLTGDVEGFMKQPDSNLTIDSDLLDSFGSQYVERSLNVEVNRLSGELSSSLRIYDKLNLLSGNLFGCDYLPTNDGKSEWWSCGSEEYDQSIWLMVGVLCLMVLSFVAYDCLCRCISLSLHVQSAEDNVDIHPKNNEGLAWMRRRLVDLQKLFQYVEYFRDSTLSEGQSPFPFIASFGHLLIGLMKAVWILAIVSFFFSLPIYLLKEVDGNYVTHTHTYNWLWTMTFLSGNVPAALFLSLCFVCLILFTCILNELGQQQTNDKPTLSSHSSPSSPDYSLIATVWIIFLVNIIVVGTINGLYVASTLQDISSEVRVWIQFSVGLFSFVWSAIILRSKILSSKIKESKDGVWLFVCLNVVNSVIIPCLATALSSPSCYQVSVFVSFNHSLSIPSLSFLLTSPTTPETLGSS
jgi:Leucine-rich repeat (LRR) protein